MSISPGSHVGPYEVTARLGEGAMGVVFRASDTRLHRDVALKLLPDQFSQEPERMSRFQREAQVLASLNHPNIAQIYGLEQANGSTCIVMELVEGETLEDRLKKGPLSYEEATDIARQLADALAAAHERGVVHRDLKPANIKLTPNGTVKVLDFGLAKALVPKDSEIHMSAMPTQAGSVAGTVVGTPGYMSPEQARGKEVDARTDIWAFGCVLYEMLTARQAFGGETIADVMAKIVASPPDLDLLPQDTPPSLRLLLSSALNKNASHRLQHIGDTRLFLDGSLVAAASTSDTASARHGLRGKLVLAALVAALAVAAVPAALYFRSSPPAVGQMRFEMSFPEMVGQPLVSRDGRSIVYATQPADGKRTLWLRPIGSEAAQQLAGTEDINGVIWSPDSRKIAFAANGKLKKLDLAGGTPQLIADIGGAGRGADWSRSGVILWARTSDNIIVSISDTGGEIKPVTKLDGTQKDLLHALPVFLPDGNHFLYVAVAAKPEESGIFLTSLDSDKAPTRVIALQPSAFNGMAYVPPGYLLYQNSGRLIAQRLNARGDTPEGEPAVLSEELAPGFSVSETGLLLYRKAAPVAGKQLLWFDRQGKQVGQIGAVANYGNVDLSPTGDRAAVDMISNSNRDIWMIDLTRAVPSRITFDPGNDWTAAWSPDGSRIAFASTRVNSGTQMYEKSSTGAGAETVLAPGEANTIPVHWSPDGKYIVFSRLKPNTQGNYDTWLLPLAGERKPTLFLETPFDKLQARVSPDGRWIAYATNESGMYQVVVQTFPNPNGGKWQISAEGGTDPKWRRDSRELYYLAFDGKLMSVSISGPAFQAGRPMELFQTPLTVNRAQPTRDRRYDVSPDGRFLIVTPAASAAAVPTTVVVNWNSTLEK